MTKDIKPSIQSLNVRSREIFKNIIESYFEEGMPVGSKALVQKMDLNLSPATIRNIMSDLESSGLLYAPHVSAGRLPTEAGLKFFVDGLLEVGHLSPEEEEKLKIVSHDQQKSIPDILDHMTRKLSGLSKCVSIVLCPKTEASIKQIEFVQLSPNRVLVILVSSHGDVENRVFSVDKPINSSTLSEISNYLNHKISGMSLDEVRNYLEKEVIKDQLELDETSSTIIQKGIALWTEDDEKQSHLIVRGQSKLLEDVKAVEDVERIKGLLEELEKKKLSSELLKAVEMAEGIQIYIGADNKVFEHSGCSMITAPYKNVDGKIIGAIGVVGPTRMNYARIIPMVDYTSKVISEILS